MSTGTGGARTPVDREVANGIRMVAYGLFALQQTTPLAGLHQISAGVRLRASPTQTPAWFAAAAREHASLLETAPELLALEHDPVLSTDEPIVRLDSDIIGIYAPDAPAYRRPPIQPSREDEESGSGSDKEQEEDAVPGHRPTTQTPLVPRTSVQMGLLKELSDLDT
ncbi:MAG: hypothetical protein F2793_08110 [Actinobacteria bacterium]|uniref:Unannotated protein n=1 Tax=freshwater metagenome TaxID=449393 RepID=A0A6J7EMF1_9ZZZZ|nr:hypothetical protein [Actinomycetota bacterium]